MLCGKRWQCRSQYNCTLKDVVSDVTFLHCATSILLILALTPLGGLSSVKETQQGRESKRRSGLRAWGVASRALTFIANFFVVLFLQRFLSSLSRSLSLSLPLFATAYPAHCARRYFHLTIHQSLKYLLLKLRARLSAIQN